MICRSSRLALAAAGALFLAAPGAAQAPAPDIPTVPPPAAAPPAAPAARPLPPPLCKAESALIMDAATGQVLWQKNARTRRPVASTTKIMTATLVIESGRLDERVQFSDHARATPYANLNAKRGEQFRMKDLLYAIMLRSSNDSCVAVAEHLDGAAWKFAARMTARAREIGALDTNFVTTNGLYHKNHYSTAYDLALMTRHAAQHPLFNEVTAARSRVISRSMNWKDTLIRNHNKLLARYEGADGVKTGYVSQSGRCLVASSTRLEGELPWRLITVALKSPDTYGDSQRMMDWARKHFRPVVFARQGEQVGDAAVPGGASESVPVLAAAELRAVIPRGPGSRPEREVRYQERLPAPVAQDQPCGTLTAFLDDRPLGSVSLVAGHPVEQTWTAAAAAQPWAGWGVALAVLAALRAAPRLRRMARRARRRRVVARPRSLRPARED